MENVLPCIRCGKLFDLYRSDYASVSLTVRENTLKDEYIHTRKKVVDDTAVLCGECMGEYQDAIDLILRGDCREPAEETGCEVYILRYRAREPKIERHETSEKTADDYNNGNEDGKPRGHVHSALIHAFPVGTPEEDIIKWFTEAYRDHIVGRIEEAENMLANYRETLRNLSLGF